MPREARGRALGLATEEGQDCRDCDISADDFEMYYVDDKVWARAGMGSRGALCIPCLETRLGRELLPDEFVYGERPHA